ncbi:MAG: hypothetical protein J5994_08700 [Ruminococcus sp.]|nr:hypothetical protein [Ruminococcus sp.]
MKLETYLNKKVIITTIDGKKFSGIAFDYIPPQDNEQEIASISVGDYELYENEIKNIEILD